MNQLQSTFKETIDSLTVIIRDLEWIKDYQITTSSKQYSKDSIIKAKELLKIVRELYSLNRETGNIKLSGGGNK